MKKKLTILMFSLLLAVGWTNVAQAQKLASDQPTIPKSKVVQNASETASIPYNVGMSGPKRAPLRSPNTITADETRTQSWWSTKTYTWYNSYPASGTPQTASFTDVVTNPYQMAYMVKEIYTNPLYPGIQYTEVYQSATPYPAIGYGWDISAVNYGQIVITFNNSYAYFSAITITDADTGASIVSWSSSTSSQNVGTLPNWFTPSKTIQKTNLGSWLNSNYGCYMNGGGTITIDCSYLAGHSNVNVSVTSRTTNNGGGIVVIDNATATLDTSWRGWNIDIAVPGYINPPDYNGYTVMLVKVKNDATDFPVTTSTGQELINNCFSKYESIELLTDGMRVGEGTSNAGTVFIYSGTLNRFFFISKGKTAQFNSHAPFYDMYEEFSPTTVDEGAEIQDFYADMTAGQAFGIVHDCQSVSQMEHYFSMTGKAGTEEKSLSSLVFYIPDDRSKSPSDGYVYRDYDHQPQVGMYTIRLAAETEPIAGYSEENRYYTVTLDWTSSLNQMTQNDVPQTYVIYKVTYDDNGNAVYTYLDTVEDDLTYTYDEPQQQTSQMITYVIMGYPTNATNNPVLQENGQFFTYSNTDDVQIPGWFDFMVLYRQRYESDFVINEEKNYYRNYLYPTNLTPGTGMTMGQLKHEWPNQTASYTLWRDDTGVAVLEVRGIGNKVYYRIRYYDDTQVKTGPNNITVPNYQTMPNN